MGGAGCSEVLLFTGGCGGYVVGGWLDQVVISLSQLSTNLKLKLKLKLNVAKRGRKNKYVGNKKNLFLFFRFWPHIFSIVTTYIIFDSR